MKDISPEFLAAITNETVKICDLFDIILTNGCIYYFTSHNEDIDWGTPSKRYIALPIQRTPLSLSLNLVADNVTLELQNITGELRDAARDNMLDAVRIVIRHAIWDANSASGMEFLLFVGTGRPFFNRDILSIEFVSILDSLNMEIPQNVYQQPCNHGLFNLNCDKSRISQRVSSITDGSATNKYTVLDSTFVQPPADLKKYWQGEIEITSGSNEGIRRSILKTEEGLFIVSVPFPSPVLTGVTFNYYPGCDKTGEVCRDRFNNLANFLGFSYLPLPEEAMP